MTNAEKYLKEGITEEDIEQLAKDIDTFYQNNIGLLPIAIQQFFNEIQKPTLTEDERVILRNIQLYTGKTITIRRAGDGHLYISGGCGLIDFGQYNHLFQFIKERRRI